MINKIKFFLNFHSIVITFLIIIFFMWIFNVGCLFKSIIGIPCPGCGLTRATLAFLRFDLTAAFRYHPLFWLVIPFLLLVIYSKKPLFNSKKIEMIIYTVVILLFTGVYIYRMLTLFPNIEPMTINNKSIFLSIISIIKQLYNSIFF